MVFFVTSSSLLTFAIFKILKCSNVTSKKKTNFWLKKIYFQHLSQWFFLKHLFYLFRGSWWSPWPQLPALPVGTQPPDGPPRHCWGPGEYQGQSQCHPQQTGTTGEEKLQDDAKSFTFLPQEGALKTETEITEINVSLQWMCGCLSHRLSFFLFAQGPCHIELHAALDLIASSQQKLGERFTTFYLPNCDKHGFYKAKQVR